MTTHLLWSENPQERPLTGYVRVPDTLRLSLQAGHVAGSQHARLHTRQLPTLVALHALLPHPHADGTGPRDQVVISPAALSQATGVSVPTLHGWLDGIYQPGGPYPMTSRLRPHAWLERTFEQDNPDLLDDEQDTGVRWVIGVNRPLTGAWMSVPFWWLFARAHRNLLGGRPVKRLVMRRLRRDPTSGEWSSPGRGADPAALLGALMVTERLNHQAIIPMIHTWAVPTLGQRWGVSTATAHRALHAAEQAGYVASTRRTGGHGRPAKRRIVRDPSDPPGLTLPTGWGEHRTPDRDTPVP